MVTECEIGRFANQPRWAWRHDTRWAATLSRGNIPAPWGGDVPRLECRDGTHRLVPQHLALRHRADALPARPQRDEHRHSSARERLGAVLRPGNFPENRGFRGGAEPVADQAVAFLASHRAL